MGGVRSEGGGHNCCDCPTPFCTTHLQAGAEAGWRELHVRKGGQGDRCAVAGVHAVPPTTSRFVHSCLPPLGAHGERCTHGQGQGVHGQTGRGGLGGHPRQSSTGQEEGGCVCEHCLRRTPPLFRCGGNVNENIPTSRNSWNLKGKIECSVLYSPKK